MAALSDHSPPPTPPCLPPARPPHLFHAACPRHAQPDAGHRPRPFLGHSRLGAHGGRQQGWEIATPGTLDPAREAESPRTCCSLTLPRLLHRRPKHLARPPISVPESLLPHLLHPAPRSRACKTKINFTTYTTSLHLQLISMVSVNLYLVLFFTVTTLSLVLLFQLRTLLVYTSTQFGKLASDTSVFSTIYWSISSRIFHVHWSSYINNL